MSEVLGVRIFFNMYVDGMIGTSATTSSDGKWNNTNIRSTCRMNTVWRQNSAHATTATTTTTTRQTKYDTIFYVTQMGGNARNVEAQKSRQKHSSSGVVPL